MNNHPETRLSGFIAYSTSRPTSRVTAVKQAIGGDYKVEKDFYLRFRRAIDADRRGLRDGSAIAAVVANATPKKAPRFTHLAKKWPKVFPRWDKCIPTPVDRAQLSIAGLTVTIVPSFAEQHLDGHLEIVIMWYSATKHPSSDIDMILRLVQRAYKPLHPTAEFTFVSLDTAQVRTTVGRNLERHDMRIDTDAAGLAYAFRSAA